MATRAVVLTLATLIAGCAGMTDSIDRALGKGQVNVTNDPFDGARVVEMTPTFVASATGETFAIPFDLGVRWQSTDPNNVALILEYDSDVRRGNAYTNFSAVEINIDGELLVYKARTAQSESSSYNRAAGTIYTSSRGGTHIPLDVLRRMVTAQTCLLRISTLSDGYTVADFSVERKSGQAMAKAGVRKFLQEVDADRMLGDG